MASKIFNDRRKVVLCTADREKQGAMPAILAMLTIFICYRRRDSAALTRLIVETLRQVYGVFWDMHGIPPAANFRLHLRNRIAKSSVVLVVIGPDFRGRGQKKRIHDADDPVRIEIETAFELGIPVLPVLVDDTRLPRERDLPDSLKNLAWINAVQVSPGRDFDSHVKRLIGAINELGCPAGRTTGSVPLVETMESELVPQLEGSIETTARTERDQLLAKSEPTERRHGGEFCFEAPLLADGPTAESAREADAADSFDSTSPCGAASGEMVVADTATSLPALPSSSPKRGTEKEEFTPQLSAVRPKLRKLSLVLGMLVAPLLLLPSMDTLAPPTARDRQEATLPSAISTTPQPPDRSTPAPILPFPTMAEPETVSPPARLPARVPSAVSPKPQVRGWILQVGAYPSEQEAKGRLASVQTIASKVLTGADPFTEPTDRDGTTWYRARFGGLDRDKAESACKYLRRNEVDCFISNGRRSNTGSS